MAASGLALQIIGDTHKTIGKWRGEGLVRYENYRKYESVTNWKRR